jgi:hypothetical protein
LKVVGWKKSFHASLCVLFCFEVPGDEYFAHKLSGCGEPGGSEV